MGAAEVVEGELGGMIQCGGESHDTREGEPLNNGMSSVFQEFQEGEALDSEMSSEF